MVAGLDGCRRGWVVVIASVDGDGANTVERVSDLAGIVSRLDSGELGAVGVDIPVGLPEQGPRRCDVDARTMIGARRSSVFPAPIRGLLGAETYEEAASRSRALSGKGLSRQVFGILAKIEEVDRIMTPARQERLVEVHPEVSFTALSGRPMGYPKKTPEGRAERLTVLRRAFPDVDDHVGVPVAGTRPDDVVDAFVVAWSARRWLTATHLRLGGDTDACGLRMEIVA